MKCGVVASRVLSDSSSQGIDMMANRELWLARELVLLKIRTDQANEKGWRHRVMEYLDRRKLLETPAEQSRLLNEIPAVLPEKVEPEIIPDDPPDCVNQNTDDLLKADDWDWEPCYNSSVIGVSAKVSSKRGSQDPVEVGTRDNGDALPSSPHKASPSEMEQVRTESDGHMKPMEHKQISFCRIEAPRTESNCQAESLSLAQKDILDAEGVRAEKGIDDCAEDPKPKKVEVITLSDGEEELEIPSRPKLALPDFERFTWHYLDPMSRVQGPFSLASLKRWSDLGYFQPGFRVWMSGQRPEEAVLLCNILQHVFPS